MIVLDNLSYLLVKFVLVVPYFGLEIFEEVVIFVNIRLMQYFALELEKPDSNAFVEVWQYPEVALGTFVAASANLAVDQALYVAR
jgi:hypothetical protein